MEKKIRILVFTMFIAIFSVFVVSVKATTGDILPDNGAIISSSQIIQTKTGTGPWDDDDEPGNDSSQDNDIVRSFDQITWTIENTFQINDTGDENYKGGTIYVEATIPKDLTSVAHWDLDSMGWAGSSGKVSSDGTTFTASYSMTEDDITVPGKQNLSFVLKVDGAKNGTTIQPEFKLWLNGNTEKKTVTSKEITVSSKSAYNIQLVKNNSIQTETTITDDNGDTVKGRVYTYAALLQLYNQNVDKGIKGLEYATDTITYDLDMTLTRINNSTKVQEDITDVATPILYNYSLDGSSSKLADTTRNTIALYRGAYYPYGGRSKYDKASSTSLETSIYRSGNYTATQNGSNIKVSVSDYAFDGYFPIRDNGSTAGTIKYTDNIGNFSGLYFQIFVPYNDETTKTNCNYYLDIIDSNMSITSVSGDVVTTQEVTTDDESNSQHVQFRKGSYWHDHYIYNSSWKQIHSAWNTGDGVVYQGQEIYLDIASYTSNNNSEKDDIYSINTLIKFDTNAFEAISDINGYQFRTAQNNSSDPLKYKLYYACKKDGTGWSSIEEQQTAKIEDLEYYESLDEIEALGKVCVGGLFETTSGVLASGGTQVGANVALPVRVKETTTIGETYQFTSDTRMYLEQLDRTVESMGVEGGTYTTTPIASWNNTYTKTEYNENGQIITGTHMKGVQYGNTVLVIGADAKVDVSVTEVADGKAKVNYDFGKNEYDVEYKLTPSINTPSTYAGNNMSGVTVTLTDTLPDGMSYVSGSSSAGEPDITVNDDGTTTLVWKIYNCTVNEAIEPVTFKAHIDEETVDGTQFKNTVVISAPQVDKRTENNRTSTYTIQVINLASHRLYKVVENPIIENGDTIHYQLIYQNNTDGIITNFQLLDILPYNGDSRGTNFNGTYKLKTLTITRYSKDDEILTDDNIKAYYINDESARSLTSKDETIGDSSWTEYTVENINSFATAIALKGDVSSQEKIIIDICLEPENSKSGDIYVNNTSAQTNLLTDEIVSSNVEVHIIKRKLEGYVWYDSNANGIKDDDEKLAQNVDVTLVNELGEQVTDVEGNVVSSVKTDENGAYEFSGLPKDNYYVKVTMPDGTYTLTEKSVGLNDEINSKFNVDTNETDKITKLNSVDVAELTVSNVNAGLVKKQTQVITKYVDIDTNEEIYDENTQDGRVDDAYTTVNELDNINEKYDNLYAYDSIDGNATGTMTVDTITVTYYYRKNKGNITVTKTDKSDETKKIEGATFKVEKLDDNGNVDDTFTAQELTTDDTGIVKFEDLSLGKYRITETKAPTGYELLENTIDVELTSANNEISVTAKNRLKLELPETGGANYTITVVILGAVIMTISYVAIGKNKSKKIKEN